MEKKETGKKLYVVGIGPGCYDQMTIRAVRALKDSQVIVGYTVYTELVKEYFPDKEFYATPMKQETARCMEALKQADSGVVTAIICSGDAGIYGMSSPVLELAAEFPEVEVEVVPGITAACSGAALLGAPLGHDFAVISLSDLLTPMEAIQKRLACAAEADLAICLYNPSSKKRADYLRMACEIMLCHKKPETVCAMTRQIGRDGEDTELLTLEQLKDASADMFTTVFIGNSQTKIIGGRMVTPRGYRI